MTCGLCGSGTQLEECSFDPGGKVWICVSCYNNELLREQIRVKFENLFNALQQEHEKGAVIQKIKSLARQYKLPEPRIEGF